MPVKISSTPCTQCGYCCQHEVCPLGEELLDEKQIPCKALEYHNNKYWCGLALSPDQYSDTIASMTNWQIEVWKEVIKYLHGFGAGCDGEKVQSR